MVNLDLDTAPLELLYQQIVYPHRNSLVGKHFRIKHLKSSRGQELNGKTCVVMGYDRGDKEARAHCKVEETGKMVKLKQQNVMPLDGYLPAIETFMETSPPIPDETLASCLQLAIAKHDITNYRPDMAHRVMLYENLLNKIRTKPATEKDYCLSCYAGEELFEEDNRLGLLMKMMRPACYGDEMCDLRLMDIGLKGDDKTECSVCQDILTSDTSIILVTLPCMHVFHEACIIKWLGSNLGAHSWNCPSCRARVPGDMSSFCVEYEEQLQRRMDEYPVSGFCTKCMIMIMENKRTDVLPGVVFADE
jgi:Ring finger domain